MALRNQEIGERLRELRGQKPQTTVADELGVAERTYQNWEAGDAKPSYRNLQKIAEYFGVGEDYILAGERPAAADGGTVELSVVTPDPFPLAIEGTLAEILKAIKDQLAEQTKVLNEIKGLLGRDTKTADRLEAATESLGGTAAQLDARIQETIRGLAAAPPPKAPAKRKTAPRRSPRA